MPPAPLLVGGPPLEMRDLSSSLRLPEKTPKNSWKKKPKKHRALETDVEAATRLGDTASG
jgi:hypothetical protein